MIHQITEEQSSVREQKDQPKKERKKGGKKKTGITQAQGSVQTNRHGSSKPKNIRKQKKKTTRYYRIFFFFFFFFCVLTLITQTRELHPFVVPWETRKQKNTHTKE
jgi:hypothetical protein